MPAALAIYNQSEIQAQTITTALFNDFVSFVDRSDRTTKAYLTNLRQFMAYLRYRSITRPEEQDIKSFRDWLQTEHSAINFAPETASGWTYRTDRNGEPVKVICKDTTVKVYLQSVKQFFKWTAKRGLYPNIAEAVRIPKVSDNHKKDSLTAAEVLTVENSITARAEEKTNTAAAFAKDTAGRIQRSTEQGKRLYAMYLLAVNCGLRTIEISRADIKDLETKGGQTWLYVWGKGHSSADQKKAIAPEVKEALDDYLASRTDAITGNSPLFVSTGNRSGGKRIAATTISTMLKQALKGAGFNSARLTAHSLRHTTAANAMEITGNNIYLVQHLLRHKKAETTERYLENDTSKQDAVIAGQLYRHYHGADKAADKKQQLLFMLDSMTPEQLEQMTGLARVLTK